MFDKDSRFQNTIADKIKTILSKLETLREAIGDLEGGAEKSIIVAIEEEDHLNKWINLNRIR